MSEHVAVAGRSLGRFLGAPWAGDGRRAHTELLEVDDAQVGQHGHLEVLD